MLPVSNFHTRGSVIAKPVEVTPVMWAGFTYGNRTGSRKCLNNPALVLDVLARDKFPVRQNAVLGSCENLRECSAPDEHVAQQRVVIQDTNRPRIRAERGLEPRPHFR